MEKYQNVFFIKSMSTHVIGHIMLRKQKETTNPRIAPRNSLIPQYSDIYIQ